MKVAWFCQVMGSEVGPLSQSQLVEMVRDQKITPEDLVRRNNSPWVAAFEVKGLFAAAAKPPRGSSLPKPPEHTNPLPTRQDRLVTSKPKTNRIAGSLPTEQREDWFCIASGVKQGPLPFAELKAMANEGRLRQTDRVWRSSSPKFRKAAEIDGLREG